MLVYINCSSEILFIFNYLFYAFRNDDLQAAPEKLATIYAQNFLSYFDRNLSMNVQCFGLNCAPPEAILTSLNYIFKHNTVINRAREEKRDFLCS